MIIRIGVGSVGCLPVSGGAVLLCRVEPARQARFTVSLASVVGGLTVLYAGLPWSVSRGGGGQTAGIELTEVCGRGILLLAARAGRKRSRGGTDRKTQAGRGFWAMDP